MNCSTTRSLQGRYRPLVRRAWDRFAAEHAIAPDDRDQYQAWYRDALRKTIGAETTAGASPATMQRVIEAFDGMGLERPDQDGPADAPRIPAFSARQNACFKDVVAKAWRKVQDTDPSVDFAAWFEARMRDAQLGDNGGFSGGNLFDRAMCLFGVIAGDDFWIRRTAEARERRIRHVIRAKLAELGSLTQRELDWSYVQGIHDQAKLSHSLDDCPAEYLLSILQMLGSAIARERRK